MQRRDSAEAAGSDGVGSVLGGVGEADPVAVRRWVRRVLADPATALRGLLLGQAIADRRSIPSMPRSAAVKAPRDG